MTGSWAAAEAMRQINPDVAPLYPITPSSEIAERFSDFYADGLVDTELVLVESEHSAMAAAVGAVASGARAMTATDAQGLMYMFEELPIASGSRLPIILNICTRAISSPANIHCDHSDVMSMRDQGWIQIFCSTAQEVYEHNFIGIKTAEHPKVMLPCAVIQDGFINSGNVVKVKLYDDKIIKRFVKSGFKPVYSLLDLKNPVTVGGIKLMDSYYESKILQLGAMENAKKVFLDAGKKFSKITGKRYGYFENYFCDGADAVLVMLGADAETTKDIVDKLRARGEKVGLLRIILFRPFPYEEVEAVLKNKKIIGVMDRVAFTGTTTPLASEIKNALFDAKTKVQSYIFGVGGRYLYEKEIEKVFDELLKGKTSSKARCIGCGYEH